MILEVGDLVYGWGMPGTIGVILEDPNPEASHVLLYWLKTPDGLFDRTVEEGTVSCLVKAS